MEAINWSCLMCENKWGSFLRVMQQVWASEEPIRFVLRQQAGMAELLFIIADQHVYEIKPKMNAVLWKPCKTAAWDYWRNTGNGKAYICMLKMKKKAQKGMGKVFAIQRK